MKSILALSAAAGLGRAILLPPGMALESDFAVVDPFAHLMKLECPGCRFDENRNEEAVSIQDDSASLLLNFSTADTVLNLNGAQIYPPALTNGNIEPIYASEVATADSLTDITAHPGDHLSKPFQISGYSLMIAGGRTTEMGDEIIPVTLTISAMEGRPVVVPSVTLTLRKDASDASLMILNTEKHAPPPPPMGGAPMPPSECHDWPILCKVREIFENARIHGLGAMKHGCMKGKGPHGNKGPKEGKLGESAFKNGKVPHNLHHGPHSHHDGAGSMHKFAHPHHGHHHHAGHRLHRYLHIIARVVAPIVIGVAAGMMAYLVGMHVGLLIGFVWIKLRARRAPAYEEIAQDDEEQGIVDAAILSEKEALVQHLQGEEEPLGEAPPVYQEPPVYEETEKEAVEKDGVEKDAVEKD